MYFESVGRGDDGIEGEMLLDLGLLGSRIRDDVRDGDRVDGAGTGRQDQTDRGGTNCVGSNSEGIGTSGRGACPGQDSCQSAKLIRVSCANSDIPTPLPGHPNFGKRSF